MSELFRQVGKNLHVLGQIEGVDLEIYKDIVLPRVLEQVLLTSFFPVYVCITDQNRLSDVFYIYIHIGTGCQL